MYERLQNILFKDGDDSINKDNLEEVLTGIASADQKDYMIL